MLREFSTREVEIIPRSLVALSLFVAMSACTVFSPGTDTAEKSPAPESPSEPVIQPPQALPPPPPAEATPVLPLDKALTNATNALVSQTRLPSAQQQPEGKHLLVIDPLIDGVSGLQSKATRSMESRITDLIRASYPQFSVQPFSAANVRKSPLVLVGMLTPVNKQAQVAGQREAYRICLALADLKSGTVVAKATARAKLEGVEHTPTPFFRDSPAWMRDGPVEGYIKTCQASKVGDSVQLSYLDGIAAATVISEAIAAYDNGRYREALELYTDAAQMPAGNQLRVYNGLYLTNLKLGRKDASKEAFGKIVEYGLANKRLALKFLFKPGTTAFWPDAKTSGSYSLWLKEIAKRAAQNHSCLEITGHTSPTGSEAVNERLSQLRAEYIKKRLQAEAPALNGRAIASGAGSRENLIGTGKDDLTDALDRRIVFQVHSC
jgi:outer membrane protein OmpA-like peptidoglycan-associated protein